MGVTHKLELPVKLYEQIRGILVIWMLDGPQELAPFVRDQPNAPLACLDLGFQEDGVLVAISIIKEEQNVKIAEVRERLFDDDPGFLDLAEIGFGALEGESGRGQGNPAGVPRHLPRTSFRR